MQGTLWFGRNGGSIVNLDTERQRVRSAPVQDLFATLHGRAEIISTLL